MKFKVLWFSLVIVPLSCVTGKKQDNNVWDKVQSARPIECGAWPLTDKDLFVEDLDTFNQRPYGFYARVRQRDGSRKDVFANYESSQEIKSDELIRRDYDSGSHVLGIAVFGKEAYVFIAKAINDTSIVLQVRSLASNVKIMETKAIPIAAVKAKILQDQKNVWLVLYSTSSVVGAVQLERVKQSFALRNVTSIPSSENAKFYIYKSQLKKWDDAQAQGEPFRYSVSDLKGRAKYFSFQSNISVESWIVNGGAKFGEYFAALKGNSLIGQGSLDVYGLAEEPGEYRTAWTKNFSFKHAHLADPYVIGPYIFVMQWLNDENILTLIKTDPKGAQIVSDYGTFDQGSRVDAGFIDELSGNLVFTVRSKKESSWSYKICSIKL